MSFMIMPFIRLVAAALMLSFVLVGANGCASTLRTQVTTFSSEFNDYRGQRYELRPSAEQRESLEFESHAASLRAVLERQGMVRATTGQAADLAVIMRYSVSASQSSGGGGTLGVGGGGFSFGSGGIGIGISVPIGGRREPEIIGYRREVQVQIDRLGSAGSRVFEGKAVSEGRSASLAPVMPLMLQAMFEGFPGANGTTRVVEVPLQGDAQD